MKYRLIMVFLICKALISIGKVDDTAIGEAVFQEVMLHNYVVAMGIYANV